MGIDLHRAYHGLVVDAGSGDHRTDDGREHDDVVAFSIFDVDSRANSRVLTYSTNTSFVTIAAQDFVLRGRCSASLNTRRKIPRRSETVCVYPMEPTGQRPRRGAERIAATT
jgi:hypothetical protein